jgi:hypothetical protein
MAGFLATMTPEQLAAAAAYEGDDTQGIKGDTSMIDWSKIQSPLDRQKQAFRDLRDAIRAEHARDITPTDDTQ